MLGDRKVVAAVGDADHDAAARAGFDVDGVVADAETGDDLEVRCAVEQWLVHLLEAHQDGVRARNGGGQLGGAGAAEMAEGDVVAGFEQGHAAGVQRAAQDDGGHGAAFLGVARAMLRRGAGARKPRLRQARLEVISRLA